ncbi:unannotated protein [freshwater metagenome]|uniref:Unannotated protein n=1 Tax=freshwater metagenome TaxID=449393 RepID=A0A6J6BTI8_9ZZZZ
MLGAAGVVTGQSEVDGLHVTDRRANANSKGVAAGSRNLSQQELPRLRGHFRLDQTAEIGL